MKIKKFLKVFLVLLLSISFVSCKNKNKIENAKELFSLSKENNMKVDKEKKKIQIYAIVNGKYFQEPTRHAVISQSGKFHDKSIFRAFTTPSDFYNALIEIGAKPGNNMTMDNATTTTTQGTDLKITISYKDDKTGKNINKAITDSNGKEIKIRFTGNLDNANSKNTGCLTCLDSCVVGITSNASYPYGSVEKVKTVEFKGNPKNIPKDGEPVIITYEISK